MIMNYIFHQDNNQLTNLSFWTSNTNIHNNWRQNSESRKLHGRSYMNITVAIEERIRISTKNNIIEWRFWPKTNLKCRTRLHQKTENGNTTQKFIQFQRHFKLKTKKYIIENLSKEGNIKIDTKPLPKTAN